jgi:RND family efflux transporter MFP subunit
VIAPKKQSLVGLRVAAVEKAAATERLRLYGRVAVDERRVYRVDVGINGFVRELSPATTGAHVRKDEWLAAISAPEARSLIQGYLASVEVLDRTRNGAEGAVSTQAAALAAQQMQDRLLAIGISRVQIDDIARTREAPTTITIGAPADGFVIGRTVSLGQKVDRGDELFRIADLERVWVHAEAFGAEAEYVAPGAIVDVSIPGRATSLRGRVSRDVQPQFDPASQSVKLRLDVDNPSYVLRPDMYVDVDLPVTLPPAITVPTDAIIDSGLTRTVFVERQPGIFEPRDVETGLRFGGRVEIVNGLTAGERVVIAGTFVLDAERRIQTSTSNERRHP